MSQQGRCFDGFLHERVCECHIPPPTFNFSLPEKPSYTTTVPTISTTFTTEGLTQTPDVDSTQFPITDEHTHPKTITAEDLTNSSDILGTTEFTFEYSSTPEGTTSNPEDIKHSTVMSSNDPQPTDSGWEGWQIFLIVFFVILIIITVVVCIRIYIKRYQGPNEKSKEVESSQVVCDGNVKKMSVGKGSLELQPNYKNGSTEKVKTISSGINFGEAPGTPILNVPRGIKVGNYEDMASSEEDLNSPRNSHPPVVREHSRAPLVENEFDFKDEFGLKNNSNSFDTKL
ncbi:uncharacterized protein [Antedon mediterranea]|uniref:uncharacterized protein isoform X3 n=1 Tax=Antedon mediterranea TaxID=105859 RepID=UPI003AF6BEE3